MKLREDFELNILGSKWAVRWKTEDEEPRLVKENADAFCDHTKREIIMGLYAEWNYTVGEVEGYLRRVMRHEILHAFFYESGLGDDFEHNQSGQEELIIDWMALQFPKIQEAFAAAGAL